MMNKTISRITCSLCLGILAATLGAYSSNIILAGFMISPPEVGLYFIEAFVIAGFSGLFYGIICIANEFAFLRCVTWCMFFYACLFVTMSSLTYHFNAEGHTLKDDLPFLVPKFVAEAINAGFAGYLTALGTRIWNEEQDRPKSAQPRNDTSKSRPAYYKM